MHFLKTFIIGMAIISSTHITAAESHEVAIPIIMPSAQDNECSICLDPLSTKHTVTLQCHVKHRFHKLCLDEHFCKRKDPCCPLCRSEMTNYINPEHIRLKYPRQTNAEPHLPLCPCDRNNCHLISAGAIVTTFGFLFLKLTGVI